MKKMKNTGLAVSQDLAHEDYKKNKTLHTNLKLAQNKLNAKMKVIVLFEGKKVHLWSTEK